MNLSQLLQYMQVLLEQGKMDAFFSELKQINQPELAKDVNDLEKQWNTLLFMKSREMADDVQVNLMYIATFRQFVNTVAKKATDTTSLSYSQTVIEKPKSSEATKVVQPKTAGVDTTDTDLRPDLTEEERQLIGRRPTIITILCVLGFIGTFVALIQLPSMTDRLGVGIGFALWTLFLRALGFLHYIGLWMMKRWNVLVYAFSYIVSLISWAFTGFKLPVLSGGIVVGVAAFTIVFTFFYWGVLVYYYRRMT